MLKFRPIEKSDIKLLNDTYKSPDALGCECNAVSAYLWSREYDLRIAVFDGTVIKAYYRDDGSVWGYCLPHGKNVKGAVEEIIRSAEQNGEEAAFDYMSADEKDELEKLFPNRFTFINQYDTRDYIYLTENLASLSGKRFHAKRNHISKFFRTYPNAEIKEIDSSNFDDALNVVRGWFAEKKTDYKSQSEYGVIKEALENFDEFSMRGAVLYAEDKPAAITLGREISPICFDVMFEKALTEFEGSYSVINNEFAKLLTNYKYLNREEDLGLEGLRKAKLSYHPEIIYERYRAVPKK